MFDAFGITDRGTVRARNEDCIYCHPESTLFIVADGMGGHTMGDFASTTATRVVAEFIETRLPYDCYCDEEVIELLQDAVIRANQEIYLFTQGLQYPCTIGTTIASALFANGKLYTVHIGDSRIYRQRSGRLERLTTDHTVAQEMLEQGELEPDEVENHPHSHLLTRAVGACERLVPEIDVHKVLPGDRFLLSSDGLLRVVSERTIAAVMKDKTSLRAKCLQLLDEALQAGAPDNVSVILIEPKVRRSFLKTLHRIRQL